MTVEESVEHCIDRACEKEELAGASVMLRISGQEAFYMASGYADIDSNRPIARDDIYRMYSMSKVITAIAVVMLTERGELDLGSPVSDFLPGFAHQKVLTKDGLVDNPRPIVVMDLLGMTAGLSYPDADAAGEAAAALFDENAKLIRAGKGMSTVEFCNRLGELPLAFTPDSEFRYSTCADVLGAIVEIVSGRPYEHFLEEEIFEPLDMKDTAFFVPPDKMARLVTAYERTQSGIRPYTNVLRLCIGEPDTQPAFSSGGAGLFSTIDDYANVCDMLLGDGRFKDKFLITPESVRFLTSAQLGVGPQSTFWDGLSGYSYGKLMRQCVEPGRYAGFARRGEYGWDGWMGTYMANFPEEKMSIQLMQNVAGAGTGPVVRCVRNVILAALSTGKLSS